MADATTFQSPADAGRAIVTAELLAIGTELTVGETTDTNSGELARSLVGLGVRIVRISNLPDDLAAVVDALRTALGRADLVVTTGGLGPTPDDLTREAVAEACGEQPVVDEATLEWLRGLWARRRQPFPETNLKQAWVLPSGSMLANPHGTAPGWWVDRPDGRVIVTLPGPPREMRPMWANEVQPRLAARGVGLESVVRTLRLTGIGESLVAERLGEPLLRATNPIVATYARQEAVDVRISAHAAGGVTAGRPRRRGRDGRARRAGRVRLGDRRHDLGRRAGRGAGRPRLDAGDGRERDVRRAGRAAAGRGGRAAVRGPLRRIGDGRPGRGRRPGGCRARPRGGRRRCRGGRPGVRGRQRHRGARRGGHA